jgi:hypothetical protein
MSLRLGDAKVRSIAMLQVVLLALPASGPRMAWAADSEASDTAGISLDPTVPQVPGFGDGNTALANLFTCPGTTQQIGAGLGAAAGSVAGALSGTASTSSVSSGVGSISLGLSDQPCPQPATLARVPENLSCDSPALLTRSAFDPAKLRRFVESLEQQLAPIQCRLNRIQSIGAEARCLSEGMERLEQEVNRLSQLYQTNIGHMQAEAGQLDAVMAGAQEQINEANSRLNTPPGSATKGIAQLRDELTSAVNAMNQTAANMNTQARQLRLQRNAYRDQVERAKMGMAAECFNNTRRNEYRCVANGPVVSAKEHLKCIFEQRTRLGNANPNGNGNTQGGRRVETSIETRSQSRGATSALESVLERIFSDIGPAQPPTDPAAAQAAGAPRGRGLLRNPEELLARYGGELESLDGYGVDVSGFVMQLFTSCYRRSSRALEEGRSTGDNQWAVNDATLESQEQMLRSSLTQQLEVYSNMYAEARRSLTLQDQPLDISACSRGSPETAVSCIMEAQRVLNGVVRGTGPQGQVSMTIEGQGQNVPAIRFVCNGLSGCAADLDRIIRNRTRDVAKVRLVRQNYLQQARQNLQQYTARMRDAAKPQIELMRQRMQLIARAFGPAGVRGAQLNMDPIPQQEIQYSEDGVPQIPNNMMGLLAGGERGAPNVDASTFSQISDQMAEASASAEEDRAELQGRITELEGLAQSCPQERASSLVERAQTAADRFTAMECGRVQTFCRPPSNSEWRGLLATVDGLGSRSGLAAATEDALAELSTGIRGVCTGDADDRPVRAEGAGLANWTSEQKRTAPIPADATRAELEALRSELEQMQSTTSGAGPTAQLTSRIARVSTRIDELQTAPTRSACASAANRVRQALGAVSGAMGTGESAGSASSD